ncbi:hypothetical protein BDK51DRAFT_52460 [Blyttiomyces helicus]|uniref:C2H2-type domain-containing protein n=1 Tax=Blyttiomyces helicus TaxID=388810 RepID=A0A4P9WC75_9FUNG|nr:hypothetical protein BDK51DRAFT_52460 [Blyttiomyces helicus]|eukprot:RKO90251.1 hypothetical protein BDK51DRAFT_52460 [Blyttiomyces helicus]
MELFNDPVQDAWWAPSLLLDAPSADSWDAIISPFPASDPACSASDASPAPHSPTWTDIDADAWDGASHPGGEGVEDDEEREREREERDFALFEFSMGGEGGWDEDVGEGWGEVAVGAASPTGASCPESPEIPPLLSLFETIPFDGGVFEAVKREAIAAAAAAAAIAKAEALREMEEDQPLRDVTPPPTCDETPQPPPIESTARSTDEPRTHQSFTCHLCTRSFARACGLSSHLRSHGSNPDPSISAAVVAAAATTPASAAPSSLLDPERHRCDHCPMEFNRKQDLKRHVATHGRREKKHECRFCLGRFARSDAL